MSYDIVRVTEGGLQEFLGSTPEVANWLATVKSSGLNSGSDTGRAEITNLIKLATQKGWSIQPLPTADKPSCVLTKQWEGRQPGKAVVGYSGEDGLLYEFVDGDGWYIVGRVRSDRNADGLLINKLSGGE